MFIIVLGDYIFTGLGCPPGISKTYSKYKKLSLCQMGMALYFKLEETKTLSKEYPNNVGSTDDGPP